MAAWPVARCRASASAVAVLFLVETGAYINAIRSSRDMLATRQQRAARQQSLAFWHVLRRTPTADHAVLVPADDRQIVDVVDKTPLTESRGNRAMLSEIDGGLRWPFRHRRSTSSSSTSR